MKASGTHGELPRAMVDLARGEEAGCGDNASETGAEAELALADLVGDANGEVVIFNDSGLRTMLLRTEAAMLAEGVVAANHVTAGGEDVSGFKYVTFDNGVTLYFPDGLDLILRGAPPRPTR
jgi:hypothetical protein